MVYNIVYSKEAERDLIRAHDYIKHELKNPSAAERTIQKIVSAITLLEKHPERGGKLFKHIPVEYRFLLVDNYIVVYRIAESRVYIVRLFHKKQDYLIALLKK